MGGTVSSCASLSALLGTFGTVVVVKNRGYLKSWRVYFMENPWKKMNDNWGYPDFSRNHHVVNLYPEKWGFQPHPKYGSDCEEYVDFTDFIWGINIHHYQLFWWEENMFGFWAGWIIQREKKNLLFN